ncbi:hypothetical protein BDR05DRAFT_195171 [Suillus weaverae]|nr:hypothetical protein BDR05DRAFT_195171 [Suillus weaverae]
MHSALQMRFAAVTKQLLCHTLSAHTFDTAAHSHGILFRTFFNCSKHTSQCDSWVPSDCITRPCERSRGLWTADLLADHSSLQKEVRQNVL